MKGTVYLLISQNESSCFMYIGSTTWGLKKRIYKHKAQTSRCTSKRLFEICEPEVVVLQEVEVKDKDELRLLERKWLELYLDSYWPYVINITCPIRSPEERVEQQKQQNNQYYKANAVQLSEQQKQYRKANVVQLSEQRKQYRKANAVQISEKKKQLVMCLTCNCSITTSHLSRHNKTKKHISNLAKSG
jgi:hypothetical protein